MSHHGYNYTFCQSSNCSERIAVKDKYCAKHSTNYCSAKYCQERIPEELKYCSSHIPKYCANCSTWIFSSDKYCSSCEVKREQQRQQEKALAEKATEQTQLKSLVKANTSLNNPLSVDRFSTN